MGLASLLLFMTGMWLMVLAVAAFLVLFVSPVDALLFGGHGERITIVVIQTTVALAAVIALIFGLSRMKRIYLQKKLKQ
jgi:uncharacterized membrane protein